MSEPRQESVRDWWMRKPMTYGSVHGTGLYGAREVDIGSREFFENADARFYSWAAGLHTDRPFGKIFPYDDYRDRPVLEIGCGMGAMASLWARNGARVTAVDLTPTAVEMTSRRFALLGLKGEILEADARSLPFADASFDYAYSWGVLMASPDLGRSVAEMMRLIKPGGRFGIMLYSRESVFYLFRIWYREGFLHYERRFLSPLNLASRYTDGAEQEGNPHMLLVTEAEVRRLLAPFADSVRVQHLGPEMRALARHILPGIGGAIPLWMIKPWARRYGWSLWISGRRRIASDVRDD